MAYIYKITNDINGKSYIGKTEFSIEKRFKEHCRDAFRERNEKRPLYSAMRKYGIEHFHIEQIEETNNPNEREAYWIDFYQTYSLGYNATKGGDGKSFIDKQEIFVLWQEGKSLKDIAEFTGYDKGWISQLLRNNGVLSKDILERGREKYCKSIKMIDINTEQILAIFPSTREAARYIIKKRGIEASSNEGGISAHISEVCRGKRKTCQGYKWQYCYL